MFTSLIFPYAVAHSLFLFAESIVNAKPGIDLISQDFKREPWKTFEKLRTHGPVVKGRLPFFGECWFALSYDAVSEVLRDQDTFARDSSNAGRKAFAGIRWWMPKGLTILANNMLAFDGERHRRLRSLVDQAFFRQNVESMRDNIASLVYDYLDRCQSVAQQSPDRTVDLVSNFTRPLPLAVICELLGLPEADRDQFSRWAEASLSVASAWGIFRALPNLKKMVRYAQSQIELVRRSPRPGLMSALVEAEADGDRLSEDELLAMVFLLLVAGHETTAHLISGGLLTLLQHPEQKRKFMNDPQLVTSTVNEVLRYTTPVQLTKPRFTAQDMVFHGQEIKRGDAIIALIAAANCDPRKFEDPDKFVIDREPNYHLAFGSGDHVCLGMKLAMTEAEIAFTRTLQRYPDLDLAVTEKQLHWHKRLGMRALKRLPVKLNAE
jgi:cytochrome P450